MYYFSLAIKIVNLLNSTQIVNSKFVNSKWTINLS